MTTNTKDPKKALPSLKVVKSDVQKGEKPNEVQQPSLYVRQLIHHPDQKLAIQMIEEQAAHEADEMYGEELAQLYKQKENLEERYQSHNARLKKLEEKKAGTDPYIKNVEDED